MHWMKTSLVFLFCPVGFPEHSIWGWCIVEALMMAYPNKLCLRSNPNKGHASFDESWLFAIGTCVLSTRRLRLIRAGKNIRSLHACQQWCNPSHVKVDSFVDGPLNLYLILERHVQMHWKNISWFIVHCVKNMCIHPVLWLPCAGPDGHGISAILENAVREVSSGESCHR